METNKLIAEISDRPANERAKIANAILETLHRPDRDIEQAWMDEVNRRAKEVDDGDVEMLSQEEFEERRKENNRP